MRSQELRAAFVDFFTGCGHKLVPSASLIPDKMSTTLFTIAGMEQFVPAFLGDEPPPAPRVVTIQRCLRVAGAKSDIEHVGRTGRHGTFLEMLGNFSFGDYYKREAIAYAWEFVTSTLKLDPAKLAVTVHVSDDEAAAIWQNDIGLSPERITRFDEDNFWTMGSTGPCGPSTEIFYDTGKANASGPDDTGPGLGDRWVEFWNLVFQQFNRSSDGRLEELPRKAIDTGAGFERMLAFVNGKSSIYDTDLFADIVASQPRTGATSLSPAEQTVRRNVIADHARAVTFLINDGVYPSNTDRGYVLRFLIRRAIRSGRLLGYRSGFLTSLVPAVVETLESGYPELRRNVTRIQQALRTEEQAFERTLERGLTLLERTIEEARSRGASSIAGADAFTLHDTYGFPVELTREIAAERGLAVDMRGFETEMEKQRERARADAAVKRSTVELADLPAIHSEFAGYEGLESDGEIVAILKDNAPVESVSEGAQAQLILDRTSFYAEQGGQIGDRGVITFGDATFDVIDAQYLGEAIAHVGVVQSGRFTIGDLVHTAVSSEWRREIRRHHTSAHLLQRALKDVLGEDVAQAGSWVGIDRMRFDFRWPQGALSAQQRRAVSARVNEMIRDDTPLRTEVLPLEEAHARGAISMFGEKYGERVRVVTAGPSVEFCGGTHSHSTGELGLFIITNEFSIGSGIRRIESCVSATAEAYVDRQQSLVSELSATLSVTPQELGERISRLQSDMRELQNELGTMRARLAATDAQRYVDEAERVGEKTFVRAVISEANGETLRHLTSAIRQHLQSGLIALAGIEKSSVTLVVSASADLTRSGVHAGNLVKIAAPLVEGRGGGAALLAQGGGRKPEGATEALRAIRDAFFEAH